MLLVWQSSQNKKSYDAPHQANFRKQEILRCSDGLGRKQYEQYKYDVSQLQGKQKLVYIVETNCAIYSNILYKYNQTRTNKLSHSSCKITYKKRDQFLLTFNVACVKLWITKKKGRTQILSNSPTQKSDQLLLPDCGRAVMRSRSKSRKCDGEIDARVKGLVLSRTCEASTTPC